MTAKIKMVHGAGGTVMQDFIEQYILRNFRGSKFEVPLEALDDSAVVDRVVFTTDSHTVKPLFFPGGDIGSLSVAGTINDLSVLGAKPIALSCSLLIEEGFSLKDLKRILSSMRDSCSESGVYIVTGDTKVVEEGGLDDIIINTSGIGFRHPLLDDNFKIVEKLRGSKIKKKWIVDSNLKIGDKIIVSGTIGDHGVSLLAYREGYEFEMKLKSDITPLNRLVDRILQVGGVVSMKDPTRGGLASALNEWSRKSGVGLDLKESAIPIREGVKVACEMLGIDPLEVGNEGKIILGVVPEKADEILEMIRSTSEGKEAAIIGEATGKYSEVTLQTEIGGKRILPSPIGDPIPRIC